MTNWLDGTMIANAEDATQRVQTLFYLLKEQYPLDSKVAGSKLHRDYSHDLGFQKLLDEVRVALQKKNIRLALGSLASEAEVRDCEALRLK